MIYETFEGQTGKIVARIAAQIRQAGHRVRLCNAAQFAAPDFTGIDRVVLAAPVHERRHPPDFERLLSDHRDALSRLPTLLISVSLKAAFADGMDEAQDFLDEMLMRTRFRPGRALLVAGAVRSDAYDYYQRQIVQHVLLAGQDVDLSQGPVEFTDWDKLARDIAAFMAEEPVTPA
nr:flavodoxin domain-containing protein [Palleronia pontilimi]